MKNLLARRSAEKAPKVKPTIEPETHGLSTKRIRDHLLVTADGTWAWFVLSPVRWAFRSPAERSDVLSSVAQRWAEHGGGGALLHIRVTSHPVPYSTWAQRLHNDSPNHIESGWSEYLAVSQQRIAETGLDSPGVYVGIRISKKRLNAGDLQAVLSERAAAGKLSAQVQTVKGELARVTEIMSREGFGARPVSERGLGWLMHASIALGHPVDEASLAATGVEGWSPTDIDGFTQPVRAYARPLSGTVAVTASRDGVIRTNHVAVASLHRMSARDTDHPVLAPWMAFPWKFPFPVEWSAIVRVTTGKEARKRAEYDLTRAKSIWRSYREDHNEEPTPEVSRAIVLAEQIADEVTTGTPEVATRVIGPIRFAVTGRTEEETLIRLRAITSAYSGNEQRIEVIHHVGGQYQLYREFIPGEEHLRSEHVSRTLKATYFATGVPNAATGLGDDHGPYLGQVIGSSRGAVMFDPCDGPMNPDLNASGLSIVGGEPGSGKSSLGGGIAEAAVRCGRRTIVMDPSGPMARLCKLFPNDSRHIDLSGAKPGTLNPYRLVPVPRRESFDSDLEHADAVAEAKAERRELLIDSLANLLTTRRSDFVGVIERAVSEVPAEFSSNPWEVVYNLDRKGDLERQVADMLRGSTELKGGRLIFPEQGAEPDDLSDVLLTVITMPGLTPPAPGTDRNDWTRSERMAVVMMHLAARFAQRAMYADQDPKVIIVDEGGIAGQAGSSFQTFILRGARDSRKHNTFFALLAQNPADALAVSPEIHNLIGTVFMGRLTGSGPRKAGLELLGVATGVGYEGVFGALRSGEFVMKDYSGRVDTMRVDLEHRPEVQAVVYTTPAYARREDDDAPVLAELVMSR